MKNDSLHERNAWNFKLNNLDSITFKKGFICASNRFFFIGGYIDFTNIFSISSKFEDLLKQV